MSERLIFLFSKYDEKGKKKLLKKMDVHYKSQTRNKTKKIMKEMNITFNRCLDCGEDGYIEIHHIDYEKPNLIIPLCKGCHAKQHSKKHKHIDPIDLYSYGK